MDAEYVWRIIRLPGALGDALMASHFVHILNQNGIPAVYEGQAKHLVSCPITESLPPDKRILDWIFDYSWITDYEQSIIDCSLAKFHRDFRHLIGDREFFVDSRGIPVRYQEISEVEGVDVAIVSRSGTWSAIRDYPYFKELKAMLMKASISFLDLTEQRILDFHCMNVVRKSKIYLGLDTGVSHLVSSFCTRERSLILQSGHATINFWGKYYQFDHLSIDMECSPCYLRALTDCSHNHSCMTLLGPKRIFDVLVEKLHSHPIG